MDSQPQNAEERDWRVVLPTREPHRLLDPESARWPLAAEQAEALVQADAAVVAVAAAGVQGRAHEDRVAGGGGVAVADAVADADADAVAVADADGVAASPPV